MPTAKHDWVALRTQFISGNLSARAFAREHDIHPATLHAHAKQQDAEGRSWYDLQELRSSKVTDKTVTQLAEVEARQRVKEAQLVLKGLDVMGAVFDNALTWLAEKRVWVDTETGVEHSEVVHRVPIREVASLMDRLSVLMGRSGGMPAVEEGEPSGIAGVLVTAGADTELGAAFLAQLAETARRHSGVPEPRRVGGSPAPRTEGAGEASPN